MDKTTIGNRIRYERQKAGLTLEELGSQIGVSKQCLSGWEHGRNMPDVISLNIDGIFRIKEAFNFWSTKVFIKSCCKAILSRSPLR